MGHAYHDGPQVAPGVVHATLNPPPTVCRTPGKIVYESGLSAWAAVRAVAAGRRHGGGHAYRCACGKWHTTSMSKGEVR